MPADVTEFLRRLGLEKYAVAFVTEEIDTETLRHLSDGDLKQIGLPLGPRKKLLNAISKLNSPSDIGPQDLKGGNQFKSFDTKRGFETERRVLTVMFCDLVGSTELAQEMDPEELRDLMLSYQAECKTAIETFDGHVAKYMGDGVLAYFGFPHVHEDDAERAVRAGFAAVKAIEAISTDFAEISGRTLESRVGIATGPVVVGDLIGEGASRENTVVGETPNLAARLQGLARPNEVVTSAVTQSLVGAAVRFESMGLQNLKGYLDRVPAWRVLDVVHGGGRFERAASHELGKFVGRNDELELLIDAWSASTAEQSTILHIVGDPGIGKSRLAHEFISRIEQPYTILVGHCASHGVNTTYLPFIELLRHVFGIKSNPNEEVLTKQVSAAAKKLDLNRDRHLPFIMNLLGIHVPELASFAAETIGSRTREAIIEVIRSFCNGKRTLLYINDCHWIDKSSESLLDELVAGGRLQEIVALCTFRPEYDPPWKPCDSLQEITLIPLPHDEIAKLISHQLGENGPSDQARSQLLEWCGGNPLFAEELARHLADDDNQGLGMLGDSTGSPTSSVPVTLVGLLLERVDKLSPAAKSLLQVASVIGRQFRVDAIESVLSAAVSPAAQEAERKGLIVADSSPDKTGYRFKHALVQDAIYESLLLRDRASLHGDVAQHLLESHVGRESDVSEELAHHYTLAGDAKNAVPWAMVAGDKAFSLFAIQEALSWHRRAFQLSLDDSEPDVTVQFADVLINYLETLCWEIDYASMVNLAERHLPDIEKQIGGLHVSRILSWMGDAYINTGQLYAAQSTLTRAAAIADENEDAECKAYATAMMMWLLAIVRTKGEQPVVDLNELCSETLNIADQLDDRYLRMLARYAMALDFVYSGNMGDAYDWATSSIDEGRETGYPPALIWPLCVRSMVHSWTEKHEAAIDDAREAYLHAQSKFDRLMTKMALASALVLEGRLEEGLKLFDEVKSQRQGLSMISYMYWPDMVHGLGVVMAGEYLRGTEMLQACCRQFQEIGHCRAAGQILLILGEIHAGLEFGDKEIEISIAHHPVKITSTGQPAGNDAREFFENALQLSEEVQMNGIIACAHVGLARLENRGGCSKKALGHLDIARELSSKLNWPSIANKINAEIFHHG